MAESLELAQRIDDLDRRERALTEREEAMQRRETELATLAGSQEDVGETAARQRAELEAARLADQSTLTEARTQVERLNQQILDLSSWVERERQKTGRLERSEQELRGDIARRDERIAAMMQELRSLHTISTNAREESVADKGKLRRATELLEREREIKDEAVREVKLAGKAISQAQAQLLTEQAANRKLAQANQELTQRLQTATEYIRELRPQSLGGKR